MALTMFFTLLSCLMPVSICNQKDTCLCAAVVPAPKQESGAGWAATLQSLPLFALPKNLAAILNAVELAVVIWVKWPSAMM